MRKVTIASEPRPFSFDVAQSALVIIDMQHDFCSKGGYVDHSGADVNMLRRPIGAIRSVLQEARRVGMTVVYTREGHRPGLEDCPPAKMERTVFVGHVIGKKGPLGRLLVRGEKGNQIVDELQPMPGEIVIDKPAKGAFYGTELDVVLRARGITHLLFTGVTINICVENTMRDAADRGYWNLIITDGTAAISDEIHEQSLRMILYQGGVFGVAASSGQVREALSAVS